MGFLQPRNHGLSWIPCPEMGPRNARLKKKIMTIKPLDLATQTTLNVQVLLMVLLCVTWPGLIAIYDSIIHCRWDHLHVALLNMTMYNFMISSWLYEFVILIIHYTLFLMVHRY